MGKERIVIFANPMAGRGRGLHVMNGLVERLGKEGFDVQSITAHPDQLTRDLIPDDIHTAVVIGGDGTLRTVVDRLIQLRETLPPMLPISMGTANLVSKFLGFNWRKDLGDTAVNAIRQHKTTEFDLSSANGHLCLMMASVGFDAHVVHELARVRTGPISWLSYVMPTVKTLAMAEFPRVTVKVDGKPIVENTRAMVVIANLDVYGTGFPMAIHARPNDRLLDVCVLPMESIFDTFEVAATAFLGEHLTREGVRYERGAEISVECAVRKLAVQIDGDAFGYAPLNVKLLPQKCQLLLPSLG